MVFIYTHTLSLSFAQATAAKVFRTSEKVIKSPDKSEKEIRKMRSRNFAQHSSHASSRSANNKLVYFSLLACALLLLVSKDKISFHFNLFPLLLLHHPPPSLLSVT
jgi:hypothetical protein